MAAQLFEIYIFKIRELRKGLEQKNLLDSTIHETVAEKRNSPFNYWKIRKQYFQVLNRNICSIKYSQ